MTDLPTAVIFDVDGTLCDVRSIKHHLQKEPRDFASFFPETLSCPPHPAVLELVTAARAAGHVPIVVTARSDAYRDITTQWLDQNEVDYDALFMRRNDPEHRNPDDEVKEAILAELRTRYRPVHAVEDNLSVVELWRREGIEVTVVPGINGELGDTGVVELENPFA